MEEEKNFFALTRVVYIAIISSAFSGLLGNVSFGYEYLAFILVFYMACEAIVRAQSCNHVILQETQHSKLFLYLSVFFEALSLICIAHIVLYIIRAESSFNIEHTFIPLVIFVVSNVCNNINHILAFRRANLIHIGIFKIIKESVFGDIYEINEKFNVPFVNTAREIDRKIVKKLYEENKRDNEKAVCLVKIQADVFHSLLWKVSPKRALIKIILQLFALHLIVINILYVLFIALLSLFSDDIVHFSTLTKEYMNGNEVIHISIIIFFIFLCFIVTSFCELARQEVTKEHNLRFIEGKKVGVLEKATQLLGNILIVVIYIYVSAFFIWYLSSDLRTVGLVFIVWVLSANLFISATMSLINSYKSSEMNIEENV